MKDWRKYYQDKPIVETYKGWNIRRFVREYKTSITNEVFAKDDLYYCEVSPAWKSIESPNIEDVKKWIDDQIKLGLRQKELCE